MFGKWGHFGLASQLYHNILEWRLKFRGKLWIDITLKLGLRLGLGILLLGPQLHHDHILQFVRPLWFNCRSCDWSLWSFRCWNIRVVCPGLRLLLMLLPLCLRPEQGPRLTCGSLLQCHQYQKQPNKNQKHFQITINSETVGWFLILEPYQAHLTDQNYSCFHHFSRIISSDGSLIKYLIMAEIRSQQTCY